MAGRPDIPPKALELGLDVDENVDRPSSENGEESDNASEGSSGGDDEAEDKDEDSESEDSVRSEDSEDGTSSDSEGEVDAAIQLNTNQPVVKVPRIESPFEDVDDENDFLECLQHARFAGTIPPGFGLLDTDENYAQYNPEQFIGRIGKEPNKRIKLPEPVSVAAEDCCLGPGAAGPGALSFPVASGECIAGFQSFQRSRANPLTGWRWLWRRMYGVVAGFATK